jgi:5'-nucleotidase
MPIDSQRVFTDDSERPLFLLTNDDGIDALGIQTLYRALQEVGDVFLCAPAGERSASSHTISLKKPVFYTQKADNEIAIEGSPVDCVNFAVNYFMNRRPTMVISGINHGGNLGDDVHYSGTVAAALEGGIMGIPSLAISMCPTFGNLGDTEFYFDHAAEFVLGIVKTMVDHTIQDGIVLNVNIPNIPFDDIEGIAFTHQGKRHYANVITESATDDGRPYLMISGNEDGFDEEEGTDCWAIDNNLISITPLIVDTTDYALLSLLAADEEALQ